MQRALAPVEGRGGGASCSARCTPFVPIHHPNARQGGRALRRATTSAVPPRRAVRRAAAPSSADPQTATVVDAAPPPLSSFDDLLRWCIEQHQLPLSAIEPAEVEDTALCGERVGFVTTRQVRRGEVSSWHRHGGPTACPLRSLALWALLFTARSGLPLLPCALSPV